MSLSEMHLAVSLEESKKVMALLISGQVDFHALGMRLAQDYPALFVQLCGLQVDSTQGFYQVQTTKAPDGPWVFNGNSLLDSSVGMFHSQLKSIAHKEHSLVEMLESNNKVSAIKLVKDELDLGLKEAKAFVDWLNNELGSLGVF